MFVLKRVGPELDPKLFDTYDIPEMILRKINQQTTNIIKKQFPACIELKDRTLLFIINICIDVNSHIVNIFHSCADSGFFFVSHRLGPN